jgi:hypothetical protein
VEIYDGSNQLLVTLTPKVTDGFISAADLVWADGTKESLPVEDARVCVSLPAGLYRGRRLREGQWRQQFFQAGGDDVGL